MEISELSSFNDAQWQCLDVLMKQLSEEKTVTRSMMEDVINDSNSHLFAIFDDETIAGCATLSYITIMPTFSHPTGKRAHLMNVYTRKEFRRRGVGRLMVQFLIDEAKSRGVTEISLDATDMGAPLYKSLGFEQNAAGMTMGLK